MELGAPVTPQVTTPLAAMAPPVDLAPGAPPPRCLDAPAVPDGPNIITRRRRRASSTAFASRHRGARSREARRSKRWSLSRPPATSYTTSPSCAPPTPSRTCCCRRPPLRSRCRRPPPQPASSKVRRLSSFSFMRNINCKFRFFQIVRDSSQT
jgi:hypothetical protein